jgi:hypothetical protein
LGVLGALGVSHYLYIPWFFIVKDLDLSSPVDVGQVGGPNHLNPCVHFDCVFIVSFFSIYFGVSITIVCTKRG